MLKCCNEAYDDLLKKPQKILLVSALILINKDNKILISKRNSGKDFANLWEFPGGKIEAEETPQAAIIREAYEELGIEICAGCLMPATFASHSYNNFHLLMPIFYCRNYKFEPYPKENQEICWIGKNQLKDYDMPPANKNIIGIIRDIL